MNFNELEIITPILNAVKEEGYKTPSPIQQQAIPLLLAGKDIIGCAQTGTGKTAAFAIPILQKLYQEKENGNKKRKLKALVLTPTRELALQISDSFKTYGKYTELKTAVVFGGVTQKSQVMSLSSGVDVLIATPGRLLDLIGQKLCNLSDISMFVLDEADRMLDMGFVHDVKRILAFLPTKRHTMLFSATMPKEIAQLAESMLINPTTVTVTPVSSTVEIIDQQIYFVDKNNKGPLLIELLKNPKMKSVLVFVRTKHGADRVQKGLNASGIKAKAIHGDKSQNSRQIALADFKAGNIHVLVATDIAARGIDIDQLSYVINFDLPNIPETYVHRIGRTGRAGASGVAISFCDYDEKPFLTDIQKLIKLEINVIRNHPYPMQIFVATPPKKQQQRQPRSQSDSRKQSHSGSSNRNTKQSNRSTSSNSGSPKSASSRPSNSKPASKQHTQPRHNKPKK